MNPLLCWGLGEAAAGRASPLPWECRRLCAGSACTPLLSQLLSPQQLPSSHQGAAPQARNAPGEASEGLTLIQSPKREVRRGLRILEP